MLVMQTHAQRFKDWSRSTAVFAQQIGILIRQPCEVCGSLTVQKHHDDYTKPLHVRWLCGFHHSRLHTRATRKDWKVMTEEEEKAWWLKMVTEIREHMTIEAIAEAIGVTERTVCNWQNGERPMGMKAVRVYLLHVKLPQRVS